MTNWQEVYDKLASDDLCLRLAYYFPPGGTWVVVPFEGGRPGYPDTGGRFALHSTTKLKLFVALNGFIAERNKVTFSARYPHRFEGPKIEASVSHDRTVDQIARDIARRVLEPYQPELAHAFEREQTFATQVTASISNTEALAELLKGETYFEPRTDQQVQQAHHYGDAAVTLNVGPDRVDKITLDNVPLDLAQRILELVGEHNRKLDPTVPKLAHAKVPS